MLQGQEKSHSIVDTNLPFSSFSCCPLPGEGKTEMLLGEMLLLLGGTREGLFLLIHSFTAGPNSTPFRAPRNYSKADSTDGRGKVERQSSHPGTSGSVKF